MDKEYTILKGNRDDYSLLYVLEDKCLYVKKIARETKIEWICYQTVLIKKDSTQPKCTARVIIHPDGTMTRNKIRHSNHCDHFNIRQDLDSLNAMKERCDYIRTNLDTVSSKISALDIFLQEMKKYEIKTRTHFRLSLWCWFLFILTKYTLMYIS